MVSGPLSDASQWYFSLLISMIGCSKLYDCIRCCMCGAFLSGKKQVISGPLTLYLSDVSLGCLIAKTD